MARRFQDEQRMANARFIVLACNAHDELLAALENLVNAYCETPAMPAEADWLGARAAIAKAKGT